VFKDLTRTLVIAEVGNNHEGDMGVARELVDRAAETGADAVKFQTFIAEKFTAPSDPARFARLKKFQLSFDQFAELAERARAKGLMFFSTPLDLDSARFLATIVDALKIASGDNTFWPLIECCAESGKPMIISTGISGQTEIQEAVDRVSAVWSAKGQNGDLALLHCVVSYPAPPEQANLGAIRSLQTAFPNQTIGYSDHTMGLDAAVAAVAMGARVIEKHFTLANDYSDFRDHQLSANPEDMARLVQRIRTVDAMSGDGVLGCLACEQDLVTPVRRSIAAARDLPAGRVIAADDIVWIRPGGGFAPGREAEVLARTLTQAVASGEMILPEHLENG
jgi:N,N'-diacetyllegionaminate synthase